jgi:soluble lytic murein transglycosylase
MKSQNQRRALSLVLTASASALVVGAAAGALALPSFAESAKSLAKKATIEIAAAVPAPPPKPGRKAKPASIAELIGAASDDSGPPVAEDTDGPATANLRAAPAKPVSPPTGKPSGHASIGLKLALKLIDDGDPVAASIAAYALPDRIDAKIVDWLVATGGYSGVSSARIADAMKKLADWPGQALMRLRFEQALSHETKSPAEIVNAFNGQTPVTGDGTLLLARAYIAVGRRDDAAALIRPYWREGKIPQDVETSIAKEFASLLTAADHKARMDRLLYDEQSEPALRTAAFLDKDQRALAAAVISVIKRSKSDKAIQAVPAALRKDPLYLYTRIQKLRRAEKFEDAAALMLTAPRDPKVLVDPDAWWIERRMISRALLDKRDAKTAYKLAAGHAAESPTLRAEAEFHCGWYALEFLHDPVTAKQHFTNIEAISSLPLTQSRAEYWLGRAALAAKDTNEAALHFRRAGAYPTTFYGQLALARLGSKRLTLSAPPAADASAKARFVSRELVQVIQRLSDSNHDDRVDIFYRVLADGLTDPAEIALLAGMAERSGEHQIALQVGKVAAMRGLPVQTLAFPTAAIPTSAKTAPVELPVVYAVARQESAFNVAAVSSAGARGLLQLMPATAKKAASVAGLPFSEPRLTRDAAYNATLGAEHLGELFDGFGGSYVMTFASYNAGRSRILDWVKLHGDPRDPKVDVVDWIELIPFTETRNYVQRLMENLQVYRARLGSSSLTIEADLHRGRLN